MLHGRDRDDSLGFKQGETDHGFWFRKEGS